jgi:hypothetical protein
VQCIAAPPGIFGCSNYHHTAGIRDKPLEQQRTRWWFAGRPHELGLFCPQQATRQADFRCAKLQRTNVGTTTIRECFDTSYEAKIATAHYTRRTRDES